jgi:hypothetical protein
MYSCGCGRLEAGVDGGLPPHHYCTGLKRSRLAKVSPKRKEKREKRGVYLALHKFAKSYPCIAVGHDNHECELPIDGHHVRTVGSGYGDWLPPDEQSDGCAVGNVAAVCRGLHMELDAPFSGPRTVEVKYGICFADYARQIGEDFLKIWQAFH